MPLRRYYEKLSVILIERSREMLHFVRHQNHLDEARTRFLQALPFLLASLLTAAAATLYAQAFHLIEDQSLQLVSFLGLWSLVAIPCLFVASWAVIEFCAPFASGSGIPQLMASAEISAQNSSHPLLSSLLGVRVIFAKILSSLLVVFGGGAVGREGPTLQISGSIFHLVGKWFYRDRHPASHHTMLLAGGAAGLAAAFNTPLGGIVYAMEELSKSHLSSFRTGVLQAVIVSGFCAQLILGPYLYLGYPKVRALHGTDFISLVLIASIAGLFVSIFSLGLKRVVIFRSSLKSRRSKMLVAGACGLLVAILGVNFSSTIFGSGNGLLTGLLFENQTATLSQLISRFVGSFFTYAAGGAGGIFAPTLALGASSASLAQHWLELDLGTIGVLAGMTAGLSALTHSPLTSFVLILEMTDRHSAIFPIMISALIGHGIARLISKTSFYQFVCSRILN